MSDVSNDSGKPDNYAPLAKLLHWIIALCIISMIPAGIIMSDMNPGPLQDRLYNLHRSFGVLVLLLVIIRIIVRAIHGAPPPYAGLTRFERIASTATHHMLYLLLVLMPIVGWAMTSAYGVAPSFFGLFELPSLVAKNEPLFDVLQQLHKAGGILMALLVIMHVGGALMHTFIKRDIVLWRMLPKNWS